MNIALRPYHRADNPRRLKGCTRGRSGRSAGNESKEVCHILKIVMTIKHSIEQVPAMMDEIAGGDLRLLKVVAKKLRERARSN